ncbi:MAG: ligase-associated DNA damage response endonuclease PdeM [Synechococcaceae cyanobacterium]
MSAPAAAAVAVATGVAPFAWGGERLELLAERAIWDPHRRILLLADLHLGKAESFQALGIPLPSDGDAANHNALLELAARRRPEQVIVLGDLIHSRLGLTAELRAKLAALPELLGCTLRLIGGNHERGSWIAGLVQEPSQALGPWWLSHEPEARSGLLNLCGHLHPMTLLGGNGDRLRLPCFSYCARTQRLALPAFGALTGGMPLPRHERQWLVADGAVLEVPRGRSGRR